MESAGASGLAPTSGQTNNAVLLLLRRSLERCAYRGSRGTNEQGQPMNNASIVETPPQRSCGVYFSSCKQVWMGEGGPVRKRKQNMDRMAG